MITLSNLDIGIVAAWLVFMMSFGVWISYKSKGDTANDYFLASKSLPWWAVGGSLIAANISAEQFIGMSGSGFAVGFAIASYELMAAVTLLIVAKYFLPVFINKEIYTMPQFLEKRFDSRVKTGLAFFWVLLFVFVNITSVLYLGALALESIMGIPMLWAIIGLAIYSATFSVTGGLKAVALTDVVQVVALIFGGLVASYMVLDAVGGGIIGGLTALVEKAPEKFDMILDKSNPEYANLPGISVLIGGMWIANLYYWGTNQYIIQRSLACKSLEEAQDGTAAAAMVKVILPLIVVIPGIAAYVLGAEISKSDEAYPWVISNYVGVGFKGIALAALIAAIGSSVASIVNSATTIFTLDIYRPLFMKRDVEHKQLLNANENDGQQLTVKENHHLVKVGKWTALICLVIGVVIAPSLGSLDQAFQFIQEFTGFISPGIVAIFLFGMFWKRTSTTAAFAAVLLSIPLSFGFKYFTPNIPFLDRMGLCFLLISLIMIVISISENKNDDPKAIYFDTSLFKTSIKFNLMSGVVIAAVGAVYYFFW
ncbi:MAG: sodium/solute symporter [Saprospiraceae bacterium]|nr:sodium/solute symporter [Saprospiraceae bacterium]